MSAETVLGKPILEEFSDDTLRIRRNLLIISSICLIYKVNGLQISPDSAFLGIKFLNFDSEKIDLTLSAFIFYHFIHFLWNSLIYLQLWRLRVTGMAELSPQTGSRFSSSLGDYPSNPRNSTLYRWWHESSSAFSNMRIQVENLKDTTRELGKKIAAYPDPHDNKLRLLSFESHLNELKKSLEKTQEALTSERIPVSLSRYDQWFKLYQWNQLTKWFIVDWLLPIALGALALFLTLPMKWSLT